MRVRLRFSKLGKVRFTSHRDVARIWERALRRASVPLAYSEGFSPRPKLSFGLALSTGHESWGEYLDVETSQLVDVAELPELLTPCLPAGFAVQAARALVPGTPSLQEAVTSCTWTIEVPEIAPAEAGELVARALAAPALVTTRERKGKAVTDDLRPLILSCTVLGPSAVDDAVASTGTAGTLLLTELGTQPRGLRPAELLTALDPRLQEGRVCRLHQWTTIDGARREPVAHPAPAWLEAGARHAGWATPPSAAHAEVRAS